MYLRLNILFFTNEYHRDNFFGEYNLNIHITTQNKVNDLESNWYLISSDSTKYIYQFAQIQD